MDADTDKIPMTLHAFLLLSALPIALFALWADYFARYLDKIKPQKDLYNPELERARVRMTSALVLLFELFLFMGATEVRSAHPLIVNFVLVTAVLFQGWMQASTEKKIAPPTLTPKESFKRFVSVAAWIFTSATAYVAIVASTVAVFALVADWIHASQIIGFGLVCLGAILGLVGGMGFNFALAPLHLKKLVPSKALKDDHPELHRQLSTTFSDHGLHAPDLWISESTASRGATAFISGFYSGSGWFKPALFISRSLVQTLTPQEIQAVLRHEISHLLLGHIKKRFWYSAGILGGMTTVGVMFMLFAATFLPKGSFGLQVTPLLAIISFFSAFRWLGEQTKKQEVEADFYAIQKLGGNLTDFCSALRKIDQANGVSITRSGRTHPATEFRIALLESLAKKPTPAVEDDTSKAA